MAIQLLILLLISPFLPTMQDASVMVAPSQSHTISAHKHSPREKILEHGKEGLPGKSDDLLEIEVDFSLFSEDNFDKKFCPHSYLLSSNTQTRIGDNLAGNSTLHLIRSADSATEILLHSSRFRI